MTPDYTLTIDGEPASKILKKRLIALQINDEAGLKSDRLTLKLVDDGSIEAPKRGVKIALAIGYREGRVVDQGLFSVDNVKRAGPPPIMTINARAADMASTLKTAKTRSFHKQSLGQIAAKIAGEHGLKPVIAGPLKNMLIPHIDQLGESDMQFLTRIAQMRDLLIKPAGGRLIVTPASSEEAPSGKKIEPVKLAPSVFLSYALSVEERTAKQGAVIARYHDPQSASAVSVKIGSGDPAKELPSTYPNREAAIAAARGRKSGGKRQKLKLDAGLIGQPELFAGGRIEITERALMPEEIKGIWRLTHVKHSVNGTRGFASNISAEKMQK